jgi:hypothetical protein
MNRKDFEKVVENRITLIRKVLSAKGKEYASETDKDRLGNFKRGSKLLGIIPEKVLTAYKAKHDISIMDMIDDIDKGKIPSKELLQEKIGDSINYLILLEALVLERLNE